MDEFSLLEKLEYEEIKSIAWGITNIAFSLREICTINNDPDDKNTSQVLKQLKDKKLLVQYEAGYRTRMAESVRLISFLKQLFEDHQKPEAWKLAPDLVGDYRILKKEREYPGRHIEKREFLEKVFSSGRGSNTQKQILDYILDKETYAEFQVEGTRRILDNANSPKLFPDGSGTIICAGTGSGKTLAFYLPAFVLIGSSVYLDQERWTRAISVYPRNELLKDQFTETIKEVRKLNLFLVANNKRKVTVGAYFGNTPIGPEDCNFNERNKWVYKSGGYVCPFIRCPECNSDMIWLDEVRSNKEDKRGNKAAVESLSCTNKKCSCSIGPDELIITRGMMNENPPDILFTTTEMMNRRMSDNYSKKVFGIGVYKKPMLFLLDEVHTYSGVHGAQVAYLLRRWRKMADCKPQMIGLSATLREAKEYFSQITGYREELVEEIRPLSEKMEKGGTEYMLLLRNDPAVKTSLLSTTIQTGILLRRLLDKNAGGTFGTRLFAFTDDLDVTNRLTYIMREVEGRDSWNGYDGSKKNNLAFLRNPKNENYKNEKERKERFRNGQIWDICYQNGFTPTTFYNDRLKIGRTSSQDSGVEADSDIVVATATLDVGYNDPEVGAIIQHKAPRSMAQFLQRKGRAGRRPNMRPWTVVVLSDYGRDRLMYQSYESLFDPELPLNKLPLNNKYILKMQATYSFIDWMSYKLNEKWINVWDYFASPIQQNNAGLKNDVLSILGGLLDYNISLYTELWKHLEKSLQVDGDTLNSILWDSPRSLMTSVIPTIYRRIKSGWARAGKAGEDRIVKGNPLPDFIPSTLFSSLNLPEISIITPASSRKYPDDTSKDFMPIRQGMKEFTPGRVSKRFAREHKYQKHWINPDTCKDLSFCLKYEEIGEFYFYTKENVSGVRCIRPIEIETTQTPSDVLDTTNAFPNWNTQIIEDKSEKLFVSALSKWKDLFSDLWAYTHNNSNPLTVRRFSTGTFVNIRYRSSSDNNSEQLISFNQFSEPVALGFVLEVDALRFDIKIPENLYENLTNEMIKTFRADYFASWIRSSVELEEEGVNSFQKGWIAQIYISAVILYALNNDMLIKDIIEGLKNGVIPELAYADIAKIMFSNDFSDSDLIDENDIKDNEQESRTESHSESILKHLRNNKVLNYIYKYSSILYETPDESWETWLKDKYKGTLGAAVLNAIVMTCPEIDDSELSLDIKCGPDKEGNSQNLDNSLWISENTIGGTGIIDNFISEYCSDPNPFYNNLEVVLSASEYEIRDSELQKILNYIIQRDTKITELITKLINNNNPKYKADYLNEIRQVFAQKGIIVNHSIISAFTTRFLKPGLTLDDYPIISDLIELWKTNEGKTNLEIDFRIACLISSKEQTIEWDYNQIMSILWPRGSAVRNTALQTYHAYHDLPKPERLLVIRSIKTPAVVSIGGEIHFSEENHNWNLIKSAFCENDEITLKADAKILNKSVLTKILLQPIGKDALIFYPRITSIVKAEDTISVTLTVGIGEKNV
jgi:superfamily II DNA or RNA helicase